VSEEPETPYVETEALLAAMNSDIDRTESLLAGMLPNELRAFERQVELLVDLISRRTRALAVTKIAEALTRSAQREAAQRE